MNRELAVMNATTAFLYTQTHWKAFNSKLDGFKHSVELIIFADNERKPLEMLWKELKTIVLADVRKDIKYYDENDFYALIIEWDYE